MSKNLPRNPEWCGGLALLVLALLAPARALEPTAWRHRQPLVVEQTGVLKLALPPSTLGLARAGLEDLRLLDPAGREVPFGFTRPAPAVPAVLRGPRAFHATLAGSTTQLRLETGTSTPLEAITLVTPAPSFLKAARLEISADGEVWETLVENALLFRQFGAQQLRLEIPRRGAAQVRVTIDDTRTRPVPFTGAMLQFAPEAPPETSVPIAVRLVRREEFAGETVLTLDLGGARVPLAGLEFEVAEALFARPVTFAVRELRDDTAVERALGSGSIWRVAAEGVPPSARLDVPVQFTVPARELLVHIINGDSPPLTLARVTARQRPHWLVFHAAEPGTYAVLTGHAQIAAPRYDLASLAHALRDTPPSALTPGPAVVNPGFRAPDPLVNTPLRGGALDPAPWAFRKTVQLAADGVQQLELDLDVLAGAQPGLADVRLIRTGAQVPYLLERPALSRSSPVVVTRADDPKRPRVSRWQLQLPRPGLPILRLTLTSPTVLFQRRLRLYDRVADARRGESAERTLATADWSQTPGEIRPLTLVCPMPPAADGLWLETENGDNPPIEITSARVALPVTRLLFRTETGSAGAEGSAGLALYYGNPAAAAPRYDLALVAGQILAAEKLVASLGREEPMHSEGWARRMLGESGAGGIFWGALVLVVVGLFVVIARLLPKPPPTSS